MWTRTDLKRNAKSVLKKNYWKSVIVSLIFLFITGSGAASTGREASDELSNAKDAFAGMDGSTFLLIIGVVAGAILISMLIGLLLTIFLWNPLHVGCQKFFVNAVEDQEAGLGDVLYSFKNGYGHIGGIMFVRTVFICLWSVLLIIPGIVKMYEYMMVPFILAENPDMRRKEVFALSKKMMTGNKWKAFVLDLSFPWMEYSWRHYTWNSECPVCCSLSESDKSRTLPDIKGCTIKSRTLNRRRNNICNMKSKAALFRL